MRYRAPRPLLRTKVGKPLEEEAFNVKVVGGGLYENLCITCPAKTLVTLRTVGRHVEIVALLTPDDVVIELV